MTRAQNSFLNLITRLGSSALIVVLNFITRTVFIRHLGTDFLGVEGLFSNILTVLSLAELGFGSAITFKLYKPIELDDHPRILALLRLYRQTYAIIGTVVVVLGLCLIPALPYLVKDYDTFDHLGLNAVVVFLIYLLNTASSYWFFAYKITFVEANQKTYLLSLVGYIISIANSLSQILVLALTKNFIYYLLVQLLFVILRNTTFAIVCDRRYPFVKEKTTERISKSEMHSFFKDCSALLLYRACNVVLNASDNLIITKLLGLTYTGLYSNYLSVKNSALTLLYSFQESICASLGSVYTTGNLDWSRRLFLTTNFCVFWLFGVGGIGCAVLLDDFISLWIGPDFVVNTWVYNGITLHTPLSVLVGYEILLMGQEYHCSIYRSTMGLFQELKYRPVFSILVNIAVSWVTVPYLGIAGCVIGTIVSGLFTNMIIDPIIIYKKALKTSPRPYFLRTILYKAVAIAAGALCFWVCSLVPLTGWLGLIVRGCICVLLPSAIFAACFFRTQEFRFTLQTAIGLIPARFRRGNSQ